MLWIDFETRSRADLETVGTYNYASDPSTEIVICSYAIDMAPVERWEKGSPIPPQLKNRLTDPKVEIRAHNAAFERLMLRYCWKIDLPPSRFYCTMFQARSAGLPGSLADLGRALSSNLKKDPRGWQLIQLLSVPREDGSFNEDPALYKEFAEYCDRDVEVMRHISLRLPPLDAEARRLYNANEIVNDRGLPIDRELCELALYYAEREREEAVARVLAVTAGAVEKARGEKLKDWLYESLPAPAQALMRTVKRRTVSNYKGTAHTDPRLGANRLLHVTGEAYDARTLDRETREALFTMIEEMPEEFSEDVIAVLEANDAITSSSVYKFRSMLNTASSDGRLRGAFVPAGAAGTGRFSSHNAQLHNFPRVTAKDPEAVKALMKKKGDLGGPVMEILKSMLRPAIYPGANRRIVRADWNAIEARVLPWLTGRASAVIYLDAFRDPTRDIYIEQARLCGLGDNRQAGKVVVLAFGYGGSVGALAVMAKGYGVTIVGSPQAIVDAWRRANRWAVEWWAELARAGLTALAAPVPVWIPAGRVSLARAPEGGVPGLVMLLPSGRAIRYPWCEPVLEEPGNLRYLKAAWKPKADATEWPRAKLWGGLASENATQGVAADLLRHALVNAVEGGLPVIGHVHDELVAETGRHGADALAQDLKEEMLAAPAWAEGLPLAVETEVSTRYKK